MKARNYCAHHNTRDHWTLRCMNRCPDLGGLSEERPSVFKTRSKLGTHLSTQCGGDERQIRPLRSPLIESQTCGVEALYTSTQSYSVKTKNFNVRNLI
ncbi:hypothetical protein TNCV_841671 [Trichonephila clavipes]|nr:hypothetical protein TNCV_841671 [Trichonephila clavipes]